MFVPKQTTAKNRQKGWLLLAVVMIGLLVALGAVMLMSQAQLSLRSVRQEHQAIQDKVIEWPPLLDDREAAGAQ